MGLLGNAIDRSVDALRKLQEARGRLEAEALADQSRLAELRARQPESELAAILEGGDAGPLRAEIQALESKIAGRAAAMPPLLERIREASKVLGHARAEPIRQKAAALEKKLEAHNAEEVRLREALEKHAGIRYAVSLEPIVPPGTMYAPGELPPPPPPTSVLMAAQIRRLYAEADRIEAEAAQVEPAGIIEIGRRAAA